MFTPKKRWLHSLGVLPSLDLALILLIVFFALLPFLFHRTVPIGQHRVLGELSQEKNEHEAVPSLRHSVKGALSMEHKQELKVFTGQNP